MKNQDQKAYVKNFQIRKKTIFKKAHELSVLCGVDIALIMFHNGNPNPEVYSSKPDTLNNYLAAHKNPNPNQPMRGHSLEAKIKAVNDRLDHLRAESVSPYKPDDLVIDPDFNLDDLDIIFNDDYYNFGLEGADNQLGVNKGLETGADQDGIRIDDDFNWFNQLVSC